MQNVSSLIITSLLKHSLCIPTYTSHLHYVTDVALKLFLTRCTPGFFEITFVQLSVCLSLVCVFALEATNNYSHEVKPE